jgi:uncharacterized tellurite resistance protein B-like protein
MATEQQRSDLHNVMVLALADGRISDEEKDFIQRMRQRLAIDESALREVVEDVRRESTTVSPPADEAAAAQAIRLLAETAAADGSVSEAERRAMFDLAGRAGVEAATVEEILAAADPGEEVEERIEALTQEVYAGYAAWPPPQRRAKVAELGDLGRAATIGLLRILESYRTPDGAEDGLELKTLVVEQLGRIGDERAVYYLAQQVNLGDTEDELTCTELRAAAAEAMGRIVGESFSRDQDGVDAARLWWRAKGQAKYNQLAL